jgi:exosortase
VPVAKEVAMSDGKAEIWSERWRLAALDRDELIRVGLFSVMIGFVFVLFHLLGNTTETQYHGRSAIMWMYNRWHDPAAFGGIDYSHGFLIPLVSIGVLWWKRKDIAIAPKYVSKVGLAVILLALLIHWIGTKSQQTRMSLFGLVLLLWGIPFYFFGWKVAQQLIFPCVYLIFCIPLNFLDSLTFPLRIFSTVISAVVLNGLGVPVLRSGSGIYPLFPDGTVNKFEGLDVADPCSGIRSLLAMTAVTAVYAYVTQKTLVKKWVLFLSSIPLAIVGNIARIVTISLVARAFGQKYATGLYHDYSGYIFFPVAIGLMVGIGSLLNMDFKRAWFQWKQNLLSPISSSSV